MMQGLGILIIIFGLFISLPAIVVLVRGDAMDERIILVGCVLAITSMTGFFMILGAPKPEKTP